MSGSKKDAGYEVLVRLVKEADVLVHNFRPSVPQRLKIDYETLKSVNPRLIYCSMTGYGTTGPLANKAGYDQVLQARSGICSAQEAKTCLKSCTVLQSTITPRPWCLLG